MGLRGGAEGAELPSRLLTSRAGHSSSSAPLSRPTQPWPPAVAPTAAAAALAAICRLPKRFLVYSRTCVGVRLTTSHAPLVLLGDRLELALAPLSSTSTLSDSMPPEVDAAASSTTGQCFWLVPMTDSSRAGWRCSSELRKHHSPSDGRCSTNSPGLVSWARRAPPALKRSLMARPEAASMP